MPKANSVNSYSDLMAWQKGMDLVCMTYDVTSNLPQDERFGLVAQMRRCAVSVPSNIAEGWGRRSSTDYLRFLQMACGSAYELATQAEVCRRFGLPGQWIDFIESSHEVGGIINGLVSSIRRKNAIPEPPFKRRSATPNS